MRMVLFLLLAAAFAATAGCSLSNSSGSISDSISSPSESLSDSSKSSSDSSGGDDNEAPAPESPEETARYRRDVSQLTLTYVQSGGEIDAFRAGVGGLARTRGITNWEADATTTQAIGTGIGNAGLDAAEFQAFAERLVGQDAKKLDELHIGYRQSAPTGSSAATSREVGVPSPAPSAALAGPDAS